MKNLIYYCLIASTFLIACNKKAPNLVVQTREMDYVNKSESTLEGKLVHSNILAPERMVVFDTLIIVLCNNPNNQMIVFSTNTLDSIGGFCSKGRARNEFTRLYSSTEQIYYDNGHVIMPLIDYLDVVKEIDVTESILQHNTIVRNITDIKSFVDAYTVFINNDLNNRFIFERNIYSDKVDMKDLTKVPVKAYLEKDGNRIKDIKIFRRLVDVSDNRGTILPFNALVKKHPYRNIIIHESINMDYLIFFDLDNDVTYAVHQIGSKTFDDLFEYYGDDGYYFVGCATSTDYLFTLYYHGDYSLKENDLTKRCPELLVFNWNGDFINSFKMDREIYGIGYDELHKKLYCINNSEDLIMYDLSNLLP